MCTSPCFEWERTGGKDGVRKLSAGDLMYRRLREEEDESEKWGTERVKDGGKWKMEGRE